ncbi:class I SAM-dependent methyltransferase [Candidatus Dependentiae bacterium]
MNRYYKVSVISLSSIALFLLFSFFSNLITDKTIHKASKTNKLGNTMQEKVLRLPRYPYQDIIINNKIVKRGRGPSCDSRYAAISKVLSQYKRPITVLDIGAAEGYMSLRIAKNFDATCVMIEHPSGESGGFLKQLCQLNTDRDNLVLLYKKITAEELKLLSSCERFDVVIALNVLHHFPKDKWKIAANSILSMADYAIIETPPVEDTGSIGKPTLPGIIKFLKSHRGKIIARTSRRHTRPDTFANTYLVKGINKGLARRGLLDYYSLGYEVVSNTKEKFLLEKPKKTRKVCPKGINFMTFKLLNGVYPTKSMVKRSLANLKQQGLSIVPQDLVIQGERLASIADNKNPNRCDDTMLNLANSIVDTSGMKEIARLCRSVQSKVGRGRA